MLLNQHKQRSLKIHVIFLENLVTKKLHHTEEWTGLFFHTLHIFCGKIFLEREVFCIWGYDDIFSHLRNLCFWKRELLFNLALPSLHPSHLLMSRHLSSIAMFSLLLLLRNNARMLVYVIKHFVLLSFNWEVEIVLLLLLTLSLCVT